LEARQILNHTIPRMITITFRLAENLKLIQADPVQIEQIILNLAVNARDAMPEGGTLTIETDNVSLGQGFFGDEARDTFGPYVLLTVSDTGCGMDKQILSRIFDPFYTTKEVGKGSGLGLAMVYGIVKDHGGYITCQSEKGAGTTFRLYFPAVEGEEELREGPSEEQVNKGSGTILLVDDEEMILDYAKRMLEMFGYTVLTAADGETGLELYRERCREIDLVILDIIMPGMGGRKCLREMLKVDPSARVLVASGYSLDSSSEDFIRDGALGFISKPYQMNEMVKAVHRALSKSSQHA
jgi:two-component system cell cycle sensor histidine kinase/response regulator CckA